MSNARAASGILLSVLLSAWMMALRSTSSSGRITVVSVGLPIAVCEPFCIRCKGRLCGLIWSVVSDKTALSMAFFSKKKCTSVRLFKLSDPLRDGSGESSVFMAK